MKPEPQSPQLWNFIESYALARTLTPRQATHVKEAILKGDITIAHPGCKGKNHNSETPNQQKHIKTPPEALITLTTI